MSEAIPVGVIGCGRMGKYHARVYGQMAGVKFAGVYDAIPAAAAAVAQQIAVRRSPPLMRWCARSRR